MENIEDIIVKFDGINNNDSRVELFKGLGEDEKKEFIKYVIKYGLFENVNGGNRFLVHPEVLEYTVKNGEYDLKIGDIKNIFSDYKRYEGVRDEEWFIKYMTKSIISYKGLKIDCIVFIRDNFMYIMEEYIKIIKMEDYYDKIDCGLFFFLEFSYFLGMDTMSIMCDNEKLHEWLVNNDGNIRTMVNYELVNIGDNYFEGLLKLLCQNYDYHIREVCQKKSGDDIDRYFMVKLIYFYNYMITGWMNFKGFDSEKMRSLLELMIIEKGSNDYYQLLSCIMTNHFYINYIDESSIDIFAEMYEDMYELCVHPNVWWLKGFLDNFSMIKKENYLKFLAPFIRKFEIYYSGDRDISGVCMNYIMEGIRAGYLDKKMVNGILSVSENKDINKVIMRHSENMGYEIDYEYIKFKKFRKDMANNEERTVFRIEGYDVEGLGEYVSEMSENFKKMTYYPRLKASRYNRYYDGLFIHTTNNIMGLFRDLDRGKMEYMDICCSTVRANTFFDVEGRGHMIIGMGEIKYLYDFDAYTERDKDGRRYATRSNEGEDNEDLHSMDKVFGDGYNEEKHYDEGIVDLNNADIYLIIGDIDRSDRRKIEGILRRRGVYEYRFMSYDDFKKIHTADELHRFVLRLRDNNEKRERMVDVDDYEGYYREGMSYKEYFYLMDK